MGYISPWGRKESDTTEQLHFTLYLVLLCFVGTVSYKLRICGNLCGTSLLAPFFHQHLLILCLCHILVILTIFETFSLLLHLSSMIFDVTINTIIVLGHHEPCPFKTVNLINKCICSDHSICLSSSFQAFLFPETQ